MGKPRSTVLIVDDDPEIRSLLQDLLKREGYDTLTAESGIDAIELLEGGERPQMILSDLLMPGIIGHSLLDYLHAEASLADIPVVIITGSPSLAPPGYDVFAKPVRPRELFELLHEKCPAQRRHGDEQRARAHAGSDV